MTSIQLKNAILKFPTPYILIIVGPPLSGKSRLISELNLPDTKIISRDAILLDHYGSDDYSAAFKSVNQEEVDKELISSIEEASDNGENVIIDMTHLGSKRRKYNLSFFGENYYKVAIVLDIPTREELLKRNETRFINENKFIPIHVIDTMCKSFSPITEKEGFDKIICL